MTTLHRLKKIISGVIAGIGLMPMAVHAEDISATHIYHNHMPNFWPYYDVSQYESTPVGAPIRYTYDGPVIDLKNNPPANYTYFLPNGAPMPHDDLVSYYTHHAKVGAYQDWPADTANGNHGRYPRSQTHVTMSGSVINNVNSLVGKLSGYSNPNWGEKWRNAYYGTLTTNGNRALDLIHFTGHHSMGPTVGAEYFLKDLIYQNATLAQDYFLGSNFKSSKGFFPTELGFSERLIPSLKKLGIEWSVIGNVHFSRTLRDYPYLNDPGIDTLTSPPNRADLQNVSDVGEWVSLQMFNESQVTQNKFPFASIPHWVKHVDPETGLEERIAGIPVEQASSWEEGYQGSVTADVLKPFVAAAGNRKQYFVIAHDGDNSSGRAGDGGTWANSGNVTYADPQVDGVGVDEYLLANPIPHDDVVHVQDGSWIDTRDSSADPTWYHWHLPFGIWKGQFPDFNTVHGFDYQPKINLSGVEEGMTVSFEYGYHYLERNFALLQAALNYAKTAEQIWLDAHPDHWSPTTALDNEITYPGNQLNPWMLSYPVKGDANNDYAGGANPAELGWYFLMASIDSGFGYYDENVDDHVKPTLSFNQSLHFSKPYVDTNSNADQTGPSVWWPQRWPYNPGSANVSKAEGWTLHHFDNNFAIYTYGFDVSGIQDIKVKIRRHTNKQADASDNSFRVYDPVTLHAQGVPNIDPSRVGNWVEYSMTRRDLTPEMNGVDWQAATKETMQILPAQLIGDLFYAYIGDYRDELIDYYIEAVDANGNVTKSEIQQVYVGAGRYRLENGKYIEDINGSVEGTYPFVTDRPPSAQITLYVESDAPSVIAQINDNGTWVETPMTASNFPGFLTANLSYVVSETNPQVRYSEDSGSTWKPSVSGVVLTAGTWTLLNDGTSQAGLPPCSGCSATVYYKRGYASPYFHYRPQGGTWTVAPGVAMSDSTFPGYSVITVPVPNATAVEGVFNDGAGNWDSNGGQNYMFPLGSSVFDAGTITPGTPTAPVNSHPVANAGADVSVKEGSVVSFDASGSTDSDGTITLYTWSNGLTGINPSLQYDTPGTYSVTLTVTDDEGATGTDTVTITVNANVAPTANAGTDIQAGVGQSIQLDGGASFDSDGTIVSYAWDNGLQGVQPTTSFSSPGTYVLTLIVTDDNGASATDSVSITITESMEDWQRTVVFIYGVTQSGQDMLLRGGIDHDYAAANLGRTCTSSNYECAIPIRHRNLLNATTAGWKAGDDYLDWYGIEPTQSGADGSAMDWTTDVWPSSWGALRTVPVDGYGQETLNQWGQHYWMLDVDMDCSKTVNGSFELKSFITNGPGWEGNVQQANTPYPSQNHVAQCGQVNVFWRGSSDYTVLPFP